ncbi:MAG: S1C family serine protease [Brockia lithotrophica]|nr:S1C family serine protease [Brockia lithotrophica]
MSWKPVNGSRKSTSELARTGIILFLLVSFSAAAGYGVAWLKANHTHSFSPGDPSGTPGVFPSFARAAAVTDGTVVSIVGKRKGEGGREEEYYASGVFVVRESGMAYIATNAHVVEGATSLEIRVSGDEGQKVVADVVGYDPLTDLAVLRVPIRYAQNVAVWGDSDALRKGEWVMARGSALGRYLDTVTHGIVSNPAQPLPVYLGPEDRGPDWELKVIQVDAPMNRGYSGGALINLSGELVGINASKVIEQGVEGIAFAIPSNVARPVVEDIIAHGYVRRPYIGLVVDNLMNLSEDNFRNLHLPATVYQGVYIKEPPQKPAEEAGLKPFDVIVAVDDTPVTDKLRFRQVLYTKRIGDTVTLTVYRGKVKLTAQVHLLEPPQNWVQKKERL